MATITTLEGFGIRRASLHGRDRRFFGSIPVDDAESKRLIDAIMAKYLAMAQANGNLLTWEMNVARGKEIQAVQDAHHAWLNEQSAASNANQESAGRAMQAAQNRAMEEARVRAEAARKAEAEMRARALAAKAKVNSPIAPVQPETGPGLLPPVSTTPPLLTTSTPVDVSVAVEPEVSAKSSYLLPLLALGAAYLVLKG